jgi:DNA-binding HxlR family transcriptional regulator
MPSKTLAYLCPISRALEVVGESWSMLILRDAIFGLSRFDEFERNLGIAPTMLTRRLGELVDVGLLERRPYSDRPPRYEYVPTARGEDFWPVLVTLLDWGNKHFSPEDHIVLVNRATGKRVEPVLVETRSGQRITAKDHRMGAGPKANEYVRRRMAFGAAKPANPSLRPEFLLQEQQALARRRS